VLACGVAFHLKISPLATDDSETDEYSDIGADNGTPRTNSSVRDAGTYTIQKID
jgi:hypothetical protein